MPPFNPRGPLFLMTMGIAVLLISIQPVHAASYSATATEPMAYSCPASYGGNPVKFCGQSPIADVTPTSLSGGHSGTFTYSHAGTWTIIGYRQPDNWDLWTDTVTVSAAPTATPTPTSTPTPSYNGTCVSRCGYTWLSAKRADDYLLAACILAPAPYDRCMVCGWQMALMQEQFPCTSPPPTVPTYEPTPIPTMSPVPTLPTIPPRPGTTPNQIVSVGGGKAKPDAIGTIATIAPPTWNQTIARQNITNVLGNITDPYLNTIDGFGLLVQLTYSHVMYMPNWLMAAIVTTVQPIAVAFAEILVNLASYANVPLQLMRLALDNTTQGIQALLIYGVCLEFLIYLLRGET